MAKTRGSSGNTSAPSSASSSMVTPGQSQEGKVPKSNVRNIQIRFNNGKPRGLFTVKAKSYHEFSINGKICKVQLEQIEVVRILKKVEEGNHHRLPHERVPVLVTNPFCIDGKHCKVELNGIKVGFQFPDLEPE